MSKIKKYNFKVYITNGYGNYSVKAEDEDEAYELLQDIVDYQICKTNFEIEYEIELDNPDDEEDEDE